MVFLCRRQPDHRPSIRLVCAPYAGGGSAIYHRWRSSLSSDVEIVPICLAAREGRIAEPPNIDLCEVAGNTADELPSLLDRPYALLGHSMGAWLCFEMARELRRRGAPQPALLVAAASRAPHVPSSEPWLHTLPDDEFVAALIDRFDGIPPAVRDNAELLAMLLPALRGDIEMVETYKYAEEPPLDVEIVALGGSEDSAVSVAQLAEWRRHTTGKFSCRLFPGGHFFLFQDPEQTAVRAIASRLEEARSREQGAGRRIYFPAPCSLPPARLAPDEVHVWPVPLDVLPASSEAHWGLLSDDERERAARMPLEDVLRRFVASRAALRLILGRYLDTLPEHVPLEYDAHGKPQLGERGPLRFNLAHSGELAVVAVAIDCAVGIDVEQIRQVSHLERLAERYFHPAEAAAVMEADPASRSAAFLRCWTRKEAVLKAIGAGLHYPLHSFVVPMDERGWIDLPPWQDFAATRCWLAAIEPAAGYVATVACVGSQRRVRLIHSDFLKS